MKFIPFKKKLRAKKTCPFCHADEVISFTGWTMDEEKYPRKLKKKLKNENKWPVWIADCVEVNCSKEPDPFGKAWDRWMELHDTQHPYIDWFPHTQQIENSVNRKYRFYEVKKWRSDINKAYQKLS